MILFREFLVRDDLFWRLRYRLFRNDKLKILKNWFMARNIYKNMVFVNFTKIFCMGII